MKTVTILKEPNILKQDNISLTKVLFFLSR